jgi:hypothetical protein
LFLCWLRFINLWFINLRFINFFFHVEKMIELKLFMYCVVFWFVLILLLPRLIVQCLFSIW